MSDPAQSVVTIPDQAHQQHAQNIATNLNQAGHNVTHQDVAAVSAQTPIPHSPDLQAVGAYIPDGEELQSKLKDLQYIAEADFKQGDQIRTTASKGFLDTLLKRLKLKKQKDEEIVER